MTITIHLTQQHQERLLRAAYRTHPRLLPTLEYSRREYADAVVARVQQHLGRQPAHVVRWLREEAVRDHIDCRDKWSD